MFAVSKDSIGDQLQSWKTNWENEHLDCDSIKNHPDWTVPLALNEEKSFDGIPFPLTLGPKDSNVDLATYINHLNHQDFQAWIEKGLIKYGAILFRGFPLQNPKDFDDFSKGFGFPNLPYVGGAAVRHAVIGNVFTTNESPPSEVIPFHHEMAQVPKHPNHLFFYCEVAPAQGGETPILLSWLAFEKSLEALPEFMAELEEKGVKYVRFLSEDDDPTSPIGRGWKSTYLTQDKKEAESKCKEAGGSFEWVTVNGQENIMKTVSAALPAVRTDKRSGRKVFFNSMVAAFTGWQDTRNDRKKAVVFGDGSPIPEDKIAKIVEIMDEIKVSFKWAPGDVIVIDNKLVMHSRNFFTPPRKLYASLAL